MPMTTVTFPSDDHLLAADLYLPQDMNAPVPAVTMGPGFGGVKEILFPAYARALSDAGIAVLAFDYSGFGGSDGEPRQHMDLEQQKREYHHALDYLESHSDIDSQRLGVFGSSMSGGHALAVAHDDVRVRTTVALIPYTGLEPTSEQAELLAACEDAARRLEAGEEPQMIMSHGRPGDVAAMSSDGAWEWMTEMAAEAPSFRNEVTLASLWNLLNYRPAEDLSGITTPVHVILAEGDAITPAEQARKALQAVDHVDIVSFPQTHFELFGEYREETIRRTVEWFMADLLA